MESSCQTRILVSPSLTAPISLNDGFSLNDADCGGFIPFPSLLAEQAGSTSSSISLSSCDLSLYHPFMMIEQMKPVNRALMPSPSSSFKLDPSGFFQLPDLLSLEPAIQQPLKQVFVSEFPIHSQSEDNLHFPIIQSTTPQKRPRSGMECFATSIRKLPSSSSTERSRQRRQLISERIRILEKMMPWERRLDTGTMLEEAYKYVKFLEAQVAVLKSMPAKSGFSLPQITAVKAFGLERLTRQQLLQVMVNSAFVQDTLYKKGFCVVSTEQMAKLRKATERCLQPLLLLGHFSV